MFGDMSFLCIAYSTKKKNSFCSNFALNHVLIKIKSRKQSHHVCLYTSLLKGIREISVYKVVKNVKYAKYFGTAKRKV